jgi:hypothetical protein
LTNEEINASGQKGHASWLASGLKIQETQCGFGSFPSVTSDHDIKKQCRLSLQALVRKIGLHPTSEQQKEIALKRSRLQEKVDAFQRQAAKLLNAVSSDGDDSWDGASEKEVYIGIEFDGIGEEDDDERGLSAEAAEEHDQTQISERSFIDSCIDAEHISLHLPSHLGRSWCDINAAEDLAKTELRLREGQLNDSLHHIRIALGHKSYVFRNDVRPARTQRLKTRAWAEVHAVESTVQHHARVYMRARQAIVDLGADAFLLDRYKVLKRQDLSVDTSVIAPQVRGQRNKSLPWFWTMDVRRDTEVGAWLEDCMCFAAYAF